MKVLRAAFTLTELLVTLFLIALLAAILFPVFSRAREKARAAGCLSNYHQIGLAVQQYASDFDGFTPPDGGSFAGLISDCAPYAHVDGIFVCPDDYDRAKEGRAGSYRMADLYQGLPLNCAWPDPYNNNLPAQPVSTMLAYEAEQDFGHAPIVPTYRHSDGTQTLYFDGHAHWLPRGHNYADHDD